MNISKTLNKQTFILCFVLIFTLVKGANVSAQDKIVIGIHADPVISWFSSDIKAVSNDGARPGFNFGVNIMRYFTPNYSFSTGISLISAGGRLVGNDSTLMEFTKQVVTVPAGEPITYKIQYLSVPVGLKLQTNQIGYITFFTDLGLDPKIVIGGKTDIPSIDISREKAFNELKTFNLAYHFTAGIEYSLGGATALILGLNYENNFLDITKDNNRQPRDIIRHKLFSFRIGINF